MKEVDPLWRTMTSLWEDGLRDRHRAGEPPVILIWDPEGRLR